MEAGGGGGGGGCTAAPSTSTLPFCVVIMTLLPAAVGCWPEAGGVFCVLAVGVFLMQLRSS